MKTVNLQVSITFAEKISDDEQIKEVMENVMDALKTKAQNSSIAPWEGDNFTESVTITETFSQQTTTEKLI